eukprot:gene22760-31050_t
MISSRPYFLDFKQLAASALIVLLLVVTCSISYSLEDKIKCSPENKHLFGKFFLERWSDVRKEIGLAVDPFKIRNPNDDFMLKYIQLVDHVMNTAYSYNVGAKVYFNGEIPVTYIPLLSSVETNIMVVDSQSQLDLLLSAACTRDGEPDPDTSCGGLHLAHYLPLPSQNGGRERHEEGAFFKYKVDIVGHVDNFAADWKSKIIPQYNLPERYQYTDGNHMDKPDPEYLQKRSSVNLTHGLLFFREVR